jgi:hypothetical protein
MADELKPRIAFQVRDVPWLTGDEIIHADHFMPLRQQKIGQM